MTIQDLYNYCDALWAIKFEGVPIWNADNYTDEDWFYVKNIQKWFLVLTMDINTRALYNSKLFREPLKAIDQKVQDILAGTEKNESLRYILFSAHDTQIAAVTEWISPSNLVYDDVPYAS